MSSCSFSTPLEYIVTHVFLPVDLPKYNDYKSLERDHSLARAVCAAAHAYGTYIPGTTEQARWDRVTKMLDNLQASVQSEYLEKDHIISQLRGMGTGDILAFFIQSQNAAIILTRRKNCTLYESFEVSPSSDAAERTAGSIICSYPRSAVETPNEVFDDANFQLEFASFLSHPGAVDSDILTPPPAHSQWIAALLTGIIRSVGRTADVPRITKRVRAHVSLSRSSYDDQMWDTSFSRPRGYPGDLAGNDWCRSSLWLLVKVAIQMSVDRSPLGRASYKESMLFVICTLAGDADVTELSSDLLHLMSSKILRRLSKLGSSAPDWLSEVALKTCTRLREILDDRWMPLNTRPSPFRNPSQDELIRDTQLSLLDSREYIRSALADPGHKPDSTPFHPFHLRRGTIEDFLSLDATFFEEACDDDLDMTLYDVEQSVEQGIDGWLACVTNVDEACAQVEILMDRYMMTASQRRKLNPEDTSITLLTALELFVTLDKLLVKEIPMLADYSPEIPMAFLKKLLLRKAASLHRLSCAYQYLSARHSQSHPGWSVFSDPFTSDSFPVRYYDQSLHLQHLKARIEQDALVSAHAGLQGERESLTGTDDEYPERRAEGEEVSQSPLPASPLQAKAVVFELQCPASLRIWRSAAPRFLFYFYKFLPEDNFLDPEEVDNLLVLDPELQRYFIECQGPRLFIQIHCVYCHPDSSENSQSPLNNPTLHYAIQHPSRYEPTALGLSRWMSIQYHEVPWLEFPESLFISNTEYRDNITSFHLQYQLKRHSECISCRDLAKYVIHTSHTPNDVLSAQADCPADLSLDEFITFAHLRSGGSLQWVNILRGLRSRTLNFRRHQVHFLLAQAAFQVGPLDLNTGEWIWHQELQDSSFCNALLDELHDLFVDAGTCSFDGLMMGTISLLLTRVLEASPSEAVSERAIELLRSVRRKTFDWVQDLSYNLEKAPMNKERGNLLRDMAAACRSTFDVGPATLGKLLRSTEDVDALLSCSFFIRALRPEFVHDEYSRLLLERDRRLSVVLEWNLRDAILADPSNYGVDLAVSRMFASYRPGADKWEPLQYPNARWLTCKAEATADQPVHINLLDGALRVDGQPLGGLPREIMESLESKKIFRDQGFFVIPSNLPGMDFRTIAGMSKHKVHFSLQGHRHHLAIRAQCDQTGDILELIPSSVLRKDLPPALIMDHVHWLNLSTKIIEIRPLALLWEQSSENWRIDCASGQYRMHKGRETLVDIRSPTWEMASKCFECLNGGVDELLDDETQLNDLMITVFPVNSPRSSQPVPRLSVTLPRYSLSFYVNETEELESHDFKDMVYAEDQCIGALFGLENLLVLRQRTHLAEELISKRILIPNGSLEKRGDHQVRVCDLLQASHDEPSYHTYNVDTEIGCLIANGGLTSVKYLAHLHAMTSYHRPDPLTGKTGAQAALCLLQSAGCRSFMKLEPIGDAHLYGLRDSTRYPQIRAAYKEIYKRYRSDGDTHVQDVIASEKRAARRAAYLFPWNSTSPEDYEDLDCSTPDESDLELEDVVSAAASAIHRWSFDVSTMNTILTLWVELWSGNESIPDFAHAVIIKVHNILEEREGTSLRFKLLFLLPTMAYCSPSHQAAFLSMLVAFAQQAQYHLGNSLIHCDCEISDGYRPTEEVVWHHVHWCQLKKQCMHRDSEKHHDTVDAVVKRLLKDWPSDIPLTNSYSRCWDVASLTVSLQPLFSSCYRNLNFKEHLMRVLAEPGLPTPPRLASSLQHVFNERVPLQITLDQLFFERPAPELPPRSTFLHNTPKGKRTPSDDIPALDQLFSSLRTNRSFQREYLARLDISAQRVRKESQMPVREVGEDLIEALEEHYAKCRVEYMNGLETLKQVLCPTTDPHELPAPERFGQWPPITADVLLRYLASTSRIKLPGRWKECLISLALLLLNLQRARRMLRYVLDGLGEEFSRELENEGCDGWNAEEHPDWLLIQIQGNFLIRRAQAEAATELISPQSGGNTVMQLNMGEGKSSVIIPIAAAAVADGNQLVRVIVPKALAVQTFELLVGRLGGLANRPVYHLPFSRTPDSQYRNQTTGSQIDHLHKLMSQCMAEHGILLVQPEHALSLKLKSVEQVSEGKLAADPSQALQRSIYKHVKTAGESLKSLPEDSLVGKIFRWLSQSSSKKDSTQAERHDEHSKNSYGTFDSASKWQSLQKWIHSHARDILDESDEIFHTRFQLIYTTGPKQHMDGYPDRWTITQQVLRLVKEHAHTLSRNHPNSVEYGSGPPGSFPHIRIVQASEVGRYLKSLIVEDVMAGQLPNFNFQHISPELQDAIRSFISDENVLQIPETPKRVEEYAKGSDESYIWSGLLLLRGLLASNILLFALAERRWRVDYGVQVTSQPEYYPSHSRTPATLAVPYRAKDMPAPNTQFGHPDITVILTCLSYYYAGLTEEQLRVSFELLLNQDDPSMEYALWIEECNCNSVPDSLQKLGGINLKSSEQWDNVIFPVFTRNKAAIDLYLSRVVFPKEAKEYPWKLSGSSWDLAEKRDKPTTGFSGTHDGRWLLPMSVAQRDLNHQQGTDARVLAYLLKAENDFYMVTRENGERQTTLDFLRMVAVQEPRIRVLLDVGAQIIEFSNRQVAQAWLDIAPDVAGAIYFNETDELMVLTQNGVTLPMLSSPLSQRLDRCVVYLDHAHTRGTDIKFPIGSRAAVTLGPKVTKDRLVQGCMRMRKLGHGHSVMFFAPLEVDQSIRAVSTPKDPNTRVTTVDILCWAIHETWTDIQQRAPHWAQQGMAHKSRYDAWSRFCNDEITPEQLSDAWLQPECKSLVDLYAPDETKNTPSTLSTLDPGIRQRCKDLGVLSLPRAQMEEEQEREVNRETERERDVELPPKARSEKHSLHPDVVAFVKTGVIPPLHFGGAFRPVFTTLEKSSAASRDADVWSSSILATVDFCTTIKPESARGTMDQYLRPVQWILSRSNKDSDQLLVLLSPFEADRLMPDIRVSEHVHLHVYAARTTCRMKPSDDLRLYSIPPLPSDWSPPWALIDQLNVFAGQLYLRDYESYLGLCRFLGVPTKESPNNTAVPRNLFHIPGSFNEEEIMFSGSPLPCVKALVAIRNRGLPFSQTHMGKIFQGKLLTREDF
ncbi:hypothetical protein OG21DRAFT_1599535 [Imleria badia]|nr:hypothetical protein OG21DRAFT_1599535 [Imleria badia]